MGASSWHGMVGTCILGDAGSDSLVRVYLIALVGQIEAIGCEGCLQASWPVLVITIWSGENIEALGSSCRSCGFVQSTADRHA